VSRRDDQRIADILEAADEIAGIVADGIEAYRADRLRRLAVERLLEIVGEAARALSDEARVRYSDVPWTDVVGLRTLLAHHYQRIDPAQVWVIAVESLPAMARSLRGE
jgi:uncharacterized protein with HEPN domain